MNLAALTLVADIGGTNARFALADMTRGRMFVDKAKTLRAEEFETVKDAAVAYLKSVGASPARACFAVAGPITDGVVEFTNSSWTLDIERTRRALGLETLLAVNDFAALAASVRALDKADLLPVRPGHSDSEAPILVVGPGTGLGQALIAPTNGGDKIIPTEGGHVAFAPQTDEEAAVHRFLAREHKRVSIERLLSGPGLMNIHRALSAAAGVTGEDPSAGQIADRALAGGDPLAARSVDMFCAVLGAAVGDAVLATGARGGVVLGGGILPKIQKSFMNSAFVDRFLDKGRMRDYAHGVPIDLIVREGAALLGAARLLEEKSHAD
jgi:glucokinase